MGTVIFVAFVFSVLGFVAGALFLPDPVPTPHPRLAHYRAYGYEQRGRSFYAGPGAVIPADAFKETNMKSEYLGRRTETPVEPNRTCYACSQRLPLKVGNVVEGVHTGTRAKFQGTVTLVTGNWAALVTPDGRTLTHPTHLLTRCHGYYRVTSREKMA